MRARQTAEPHQRADSGNIEKLDEFPVSTFGKVSKKALVEMITQKLQAEGGRTA